MNRPLPPRMAPTEPPSPLPPMSPRPPAVWSGQTDDARLEVRLRLFVVPVALVVAWIVAHTPLGGFLGRVFLSMWLHELGHATAAWFSGRFAFPGPWRTIIGDGRSFPVVLLVSSLLLWWAVTRFRAGRRTSAAVAVALLGVQLVCTFGLSASSQGVLFLFAGDGGGMVLGALLVSTFFVPPEHAWRVRWLRWGFVVIGAFAFVDPLHVWWAAWRDPAEIPFGRIDGVGLSDPTRLVDEHHWREAAMIRRFLTVGALSFVAIVLAWLRGIKLGRQELQAANEEVATIAARDAEEQRRHGDWR